MSGCRWSPGFSRSSPPDRLKPGLQPRPSHLDALPGASGLGELQADVLEDVGLLLAGVLQAGLLSDGLERGQVQAVQLGDGGRDFTLAQRVGVYRLLHQLLELDRL